VAAAAAEVATAAAVEAATAAAAVEAEAAEAAEVVDGEGINASFIPETKRRDNQKYT
jgi:hypothetical protein